MSTQPKCFYHVQERTYAILNWRNRRAPQDVLCLAELTGPQLDDYRGLVEQGTPEEAIYQALFPPPPKPAPRLPEDLSHLKKEQLAVLIRAVTGHGLPSLNRSSRRDLEVIARVVLRSLSSRSPVLVA